MRSHSSLTLSLLLTLFLTACAQQLPGAPSNATAQNAKEYRVLQDRSDRLLVELPNRMLVVAQEVHAAPVVSAQVWIKTGSVYEQEFVGQGLSHYLEHLLSGGTTTNRTEEESNAILGRIGAQTNAATSLDTVRYYINCTSADSDQAIDLLSDWMQHSKIEQKEFDRERTVIRREFEMGRGEPRRILWKLTQQARYRVHPARHPTIGYIEDYEKVTRDDIEAFYRRMYVPNNMVFVVVGNIDKKKTVDQIAKLWAAAKPKDVPEITFPIEEKAEEPRIVLGEADIRAPRIRVAWPGTRLGGDNDYALDLLGMIMGEGESSRLVREVRDKKRLVNSIASYNYSTNWGEGFWAIDAEIAQPKPADGESQQDAWEEAIDQARNEIIGQVDRVLAEGVTEEELALAKRQIVASVVYSAQTVQDVAERLARDLIGMGDPDYLQYWAKAIQDITVDDIAKAAREHLMKKRQISITLLPLPQGSKAKELKHPPDEADASKLEKETVLLDNLMISERLMSRKGDSTAAKSIESDAVKKITLSNGLRVLIQRNTMIPAVSIQMYHMGGLLIDKRGKQGIANAVAVMQMRGTKSRNAEQIALQIDNLGASLSTQCGNNTHFANAVCLKDDWREVMGLLADVTLNPSFPEEEWQKMQPRLIAAIARQQDDWYQELRGHFRKAYFNDHQWSTTALGLADVVGKVSAKELGEFHRAHLGAKDAVLAVFGDVNPDEVAKQAEELFGKMPSERTKTFKVPLAENPKPQLLQIETRKPLAAVQMAFGPTVARTGEDYAKLEVLRSVLSNFPSGWLDRELRGKGEGLVYAVWAGQFTGVAPGYLAGAFNCTPAKLPQAMKAAASTFGRIKTESVDDDTLARAKAAVLSRQFLYKQSNGDRGTEAALNELYGLPLDEHKRFEAAVRAVDAASLKETANKYLRNPVVVAITHDKVDEAKLKEAIDAVTD